MISKVQQLLGNEVFNIQTLPNQMTINNTTKNLYDINGDLLGVNAVFEDDTIYYDEVQDCPKVLERIINGDQFAGYVTCHKCGGIGEVLIERMIELNTKSEQLLAFKRWEDEN